MENQNFVSQLLSSENPRWVIVLCNILDGLDAKLYDEDFVREAIGGWRSGSLRHQGTLPDDDQLKTDLDTLATKFRLKCPVSDTKNEVVGNYAHAMSAESFLRWVVHSDNRNAQLSDAEVGIIGVPRFVASRKVRIAPGKGIGEPGRVVFLAPFADLAPLLSSSTKANDVRDRAGLMKWKKGQEYIVLELDARELAAVRLSRPTFADAGSHRRFKAVASDPANHSRSDWGFTLDLNHFVTTGTAVDGIPERVCARIEAGNISSITLHPLEFVSTGNPGDDEAYARCLLRGRSVVDIETRIKGVV